LGLDAAILAYNYPLTWLYPLFISRWRATIETWYGSQSSPRCSDMISHAAKILWLKPIWKLITWLFK